MCDDAGFTATELGTATNWPLLLPVIKQCPTYFLDFEFKQQKYNEEFNLLNVAMSFGNLAMLQLLIQLQNTEEAKEIVDHLFANYDDCKKDLKSLLPFIEVNESDVQQCQ